MKGRFSPLAKRVVGESGSAEQPPAADAFQRPLRSRFQARLSRSVRPRLPLAAMVFPTAEVQYARGT